MTSRAYDFSDARPDPGELVGAAALGYLGRSIPDQEYLDALRFVGVPFTFIFESDPNRSQQGWAAGVLDAQFANGRAASRGYGTDRSVCVVVSDGNRYDPNSGGDRIADYAQAWATTCAHPIFFYGNRYACDSAIGGALRVPGARLVAGPHTTGAWLPSTWGFDAGRDLMAQEANIPSDIGGTDLNTVYADYTGAAAPQPEDGDDDVNTYIQHATEDHGIYVTNGLHKRGVTADEWQAVQFFAAVNHKPPPTPLVISASWWASIPEAAGSGGGAPAPLGNYALELTGTAHPA